jgi:hypothetical protein
MELLELSFTHFGNGYPRSTYRRRWPLVPSFHPPAGKQPFARCFLPCFDASHLGPTLPPLAGKHPAGSCGLSTKMMVHVSHSAGTRVVPGDGKPPHFCLECRRIVCINPRAIRLAAFSRPRSGYYPLSYRPPVLRLLCADETSRARWTSCVLPCTCRQYAGKMQGKVEVQVATKHMCKLSCCRDIIAPLS